MIATSIPGLDRVLFTEEQIDARIREVGAEISRDYQGRTLKLIGVLKGSVYFLTALSRRIEVPVKIDFLGISSFSNRSGAPGVVIHLMPFHTVVHEFHTSALQAET